MRVLPRKCTYWSKIVKTDFFHFLKKYYQNVRNFPRNLNTLGFFLIFFTKKWRKLTFSGYKVTKNHFFFNFWKSTIKMLAILHRNWINLKILKFFSKSVENWHFFAEKWPKIDFFFNFRNSTIKIFGIFQRIWKQLNFVMFFCQKVKKIDIFGLKSGKNDYFFAFWKSTIKMFGIFQGKSCIHFFLEVAPFETISCIQKAEPQKGGASTRRSPHVMVFLILKVTMSCICFFFGGRAFWDHELHTKGGASNLSVHTQGGIT